MQTKFQYFLKVFSEIFAPNKFKLTELEENIIGKDKDQCNVILDIPNISDIHAKVMIEGENISLQDLNSDEGVFKENSNTSILKLKNNVIYDLSLDQFFYIGKYKCKIQKKDILQQKQTKENIKQNELKFQKEKQSKKSSVVDEEDQAQNKNLKQESVNKYFGRVSKSQYIEQAFPSMDVKKKNIIQKNINDVSNASQESKNKNLRILISGFTLEPQFKQQLIKLNIRIVKKCEQRYDFLIMDQFVRSVKFLVTINKGIDILDKKFIDYMLKKNKIPDYKKYIFKCESVEKQYNFSLQNSISQAKENKKGFLQNYSFYFNNEISPSYLEMKYMIETAGGKVSDKKNNSIILVNQQDSKNKEYHDVYETELIFTGILRQQLDLDDYLIK